MPQDRNALGWVLPERGTLRQERPLLAIHRLYWWIGPEVVATVIAVRRQRVCGKHVPLQTGVSAATVSRVLAKFSLSRLSHREHAEPVPRYVHEHPGGSIHLDIKPLVRFKAVSHCLSGNRQGQSKSRGAG